MGYGHQEPKTKPHARRIITKADDSEGNTILTTLWKVNCFLLVRRGHYRGKYNLSEDAQCQRYSAEMFALKEKNACCDAL